MRVPPVLVVVVVLLAVIGQHAVHSSLLYINISRYLTQLRSVPALFRKWKLNVPLGSAVFLATVAAAQYGFLPVRGQKIADGVEAISRRWRALTGRQQRYRHPRAARAAPLLPSLQHLFMTLRMLEEGVRRHGGGLRTD